MIAPEHDDCRVYGYGRASTKRQQNSLQVQQQHAEQAVEGSLAILPATDDGAEEHRKIAERVDRGDISGTFGGFYCDAVSTRTMHFMQRPQFQVVWNKFRKGDRLMVTAFDRVCRSPLESAQFLDLVSTKGVRLHVLRHGSQEMDFSSPLGKAMAGFLAVFAEWERDMISQRTRETIEYLKSQGRMYSAQARTGQKRIFTERAADGRRRIIRYADSERELTVIREIYFRHHKLFHTLREIGEDIRSRGLRSAEGGKWSYKRVWTCYHWAKDKVERGQVI